MVVEKKDDDDEHDQHKICPQCLLTFLSKDRIVVSTLWELGHNRTLWTRIDRKIATSSIVVSIGEPKKTTKPLKHRNRHL